MTSIVERLRVYAQQFEDQHAPEQITLALRAGADEIERLRTRLEVAPSHPYDGIYCRDETIRGLEKEIERLRAGGCARDQGTTQYCGEAAKKDAEIASLLNALADERTESMRLRTRVTELEGQHKGLVLNNAILRERPDLPLNRIPAARAMTKLYEDNERLRAALEVFACDCEGKAICLGNCMHRNARAALEVGRSCTCHPSEAPTPCQQKYALGECIKAALEGK